MMQQRHDQQIKFHCCTLEELMPKTHFLRDLDAQVDFSFIYDKVSHLYSRTGRPSVDPVVVVKMLLLGYLYGIDSERRLEKEIQVNIAYRWFLGIDLDEHVPDHSTVSQLRRRKFNNSRLFDDVFDEIVAKCIRIGLVDGEILLTDSTHVRANASNDRKETITVTRCLSDYMKRLDGSALADGLIKEVSQAKDETAEQTKSITDPDCGMLARPGKPTGFHYLDHQTVDGHSGIITDVFVTPGNVADHTVHAPRIEKQLDKFGFKTKSVAGDAGYDEPEIHAEMLKRGIKTYIPLKGRGMRQKPDMFAKEDFRYDEDQDAYVCPVGRLLSYSSFKKGRGMKCYRSKLADCGGCLLKSKCIFGTSNVKTLERSYHWTEYKKQHENDFSDQYLEAQRLRKIWCEGTFSHQKARHCLARAKMRGICQTTGQCLLSACAINLKRLVKWANSDLSALLRQVLVLFSIKFIAKNYICRVSSNVA